MGSGGFNFASFAGSGGDTGVPTFDFVPSPTGAGFANPALSGSGGQNQYMNFPTMNAAPLSGANSAPTAMGTPSSPPGIVPPVNQPAPPLGNTGSPTGGGGLVGGQEKLGGGVKTDPTLDPNLTTQFYSWLQSQVGQGAAPFDLSTILPSTGQATAPGTLNAPLNPLEQMLNSFYEGNSSGVNASILPMWNSQLAALQQPIQQNLADLREQFGSQGALGSTELGTAASNYLSQTATSEQALLGQDTLQALPILQQQAGQIQSDDQAAINNLLQEFIRTQPGNNPLLSTEFGASTAFAPTNKQTNFGQEFLNAAGSASGTALGTAAGEGVGGLIFG